MIPKYKYFAVDEFGDRMRSFYSRAEARHYISKREGWTLERVAAESAIDWNNFEPAPF